MSDLLFHAASPATPLRYRLSTRIVTLSGVALALFLSMIVGTLWLSWQLEGAGAAINDAGSLRMRAGNIAIQLGEMRAARPANVALQSAQLDQTLARLDQGDPVRPLFLPETPAIRVQFNVVSATWRDALKPAIAQNGMAPHLYLDRLPAFVMQADALVRLIEQENARKTAWLRRSQLALAALACLGTMAIVYLLYAWFVLPVRRLERGLSRIEQREFTARLQVESRDEFGHLAQGFNRMAAELQSLYQDLALRVTHKTAQLSARNGELLALYEMTAFLHGAHDVEVLCRGFLTRVMRQFHANAGSVRILAPDDDNLHMVVSEGLPERMTDVERCMPASDCVCGAVATSGIAVIRDLRSGRASISAPAVDCGTAGFATVTAFGIVSKQIALGSFSLHFRHERDMLPSETRLLETLGRHLGTALQNHRLAAAARQLAVAQERHLVAQGLHDSIAQSLNFLKMQLHLLDTAATRDDLNEIREIVPLLRGGLEESYEDVRELLVNFRTKFGAGNLRDAIEETVTRFERQSGSPLHLDYEEASGLPLPSDQQLQVLFILQEALSNVRKHASASNVRVVIRNAEDFHLTVQDDGDGYDPADIASRGEAHVGFHIMRERAARLGAQLRLESRPGGGARVHLLLPASRRQAA
ncbi:MULTISPECIES: type IV pili methyl-accepting chemotaxis transducer N-terminal domain-containing protein [Burkholderiaceae]|uniref:Sensor protein n=1 Tax=Caballeronia sordidicola TaxID=196367 RepID=A0A242MCM6_CABSO|nr:MULTISPECIES: type IV pili methyl-accepting chemotaxis transducer N-terminal domain-containing protein [Burkholderiaceae]AME25745.1 histidine kinase [Burkholderia sp. PAMC 26561]OTP68962.1 Nitrate/nitrite sensor protein [Caballeronia sordidicola]